MNGVSWQGFKSKPWNPVQLQAEREADEAVSLPILRARTAEALKRREAAQDAFMQLDANVQAVLAPYTSLTLTTPGER